MLIKIMAYSGLRWLAMASENPSAQSLYVHGFFAIPPKITSVNTNKKL